MAPLFSSVTRIHPMVSGAVMVLGAIVAINGVSRSAATPMLGGAAGFVIALCALAVSVVARRGRGGNALPFGRIVVVLLAVALAFAVIGALASVH